MQDRLIAMVQIVADAGAISTVTASELIAAHKHVVAQEVASERKAAADAVRVFAGKLERDER